MVEHFLQYIYYVKLFLQVLNVNSLQHVTVNEITQQHLWSRINCIRAFVIGKYNNGFSALEAMVFFYQK